MAYAGISNTEGPQLVRVKVKGLGDVDKALGRSRGRKISLSGNHPVKLRPRGIKRGTMVLVLALQLVFVQI
jgi:hypothetical protein